MGGGVPLHPGRAPLARRAVASVLVVVVAGGCDGSEPATLQAIAEAASAERHDGGFAVVVTHADGSRDVGAAGTLADSSAMDPAGTWIIGSVSKAFVATVVLQLVEEGLLTLDEPAARHVDHEFVPAAATILDLLHHSSGIPDYVRDEEWAATMRSCPERAPHPYDHVAADPDFPPGTQWGYSNTNYLLLGEIVEAVTGRPVQVELRRRILQPLGLDDTYVLDVEEGPPPMAASQDFFLTGPGPLDDCSMEPAPGPAPVDARMVSSVADLDGFYRALFGGELLGEQALDAMTAQTYVGSSASGHGLGVVRLLEPPVPDVEIHANGGGVVGYQTLLMIDLRSMTTIVAVSPNGVGFERQQDAILRVAFPTDAATHSYPGPAQDRPALPDLVTAAPHRVRGAA